MSMEEVDALLNAVLPFAQQMLEKYGQFYPLGASMDKSGKVGLVGVMPKSSAKSALPPFALMERLLRREARRKAMRFARTSSTNRGFPLLRTCPIERKFPGR